MKFLMRRNYFQDIQLFKFRSTLFWYLALVVALVAAPFFIGTYFTYIFTLIAIYAIVSLGLNILTGYTGQISLGHAAFFAIGAYTSAYLTATAGLSFWLALPAAGLAAAVVGLVVGIPSLRLSGLYLAIATMGLAFIIEEVILQWKDVTNGINGMALLRPQLGPIAFDTDQKYYYLSLAFLILFILVAKNLLRTPTGRAFIAVRDSEIAAQAVGINLARYKVWAFVISAFYAGVAGSLFGHFMTFIGPDNFTLLESIGFLAMIIVGGIASVHGSIYGAVFMTFLPELIRLAKDYLPPILQEKVGLQAAAYGIILMLFVIFEPMGLYGRWLKLKFYFETFPVYKKETFRRERKFYRSERSR
jgi:branched-chain amino acid transport system permease protein